MNDLRCVGEHLFLSIVGVMTRVVAHWFHMVEGTLGMMNHTIPLHYKTQEI